jgi:hypothetical protein
VQPTCSSSTCSSRVSNLHMQQPKSPQQLSRMSRWALACDPFRPSAVTHLELATACCSA